MVSGGFEIIVHLTKTGIVEYRADFGFDYEWARGQVLEDHTDTRWRATPEPSIPSRSLPTANSFAREVKMYPSNFGTQPMEAW